MTFVIQPAPTGTLGNWSPKNQECQNAKLIPNLLAFVLKGPARLFGPRPGRAAGPVAAQPPPAGVFNRRHARLHRPRGAAEEGVRHGVRLVVRGGHHV